MCYVMVLFIAPPTNKASVVHLLETLDGNALKSDFFFLFVFLQKITLRWEPG